MLIQLPSGSPDQQDSKADANNAFEAGLRRDLASAPIVSYDATLGGWPKRALELFLSVLTVPAWMPVMLGAAALAKLRHRAPVFVTHDRIGYGGRVFKCFELQLEAPPSQVVRIQAEPESPANEWSVIASGAESRKTKWRRVIERLPQMLNVIRGDMALIGPSPLSREELEPLKTPRRYYLSARPGVIGISAIAEGDETNANQYKIYAISWAFSTDALILWDAIRSLLNRGELWKPSIKLPAKPGASAVVVVRRRNDG